MIEIPTGHEWTIPEHVKHMYIEMMKFFVSATVFNDSELSEVPNVKNRREVIKYHH